MAQSKPIALDTNCVLRWLLRDNNTQADIVENHMKAAKARLHVSDMVFAEVVWVLKSYYEFDDRLIEGFMRKLIENDKINCNRELFGRVLDHINTRPTVSFIDTCLVFYAELSDARLLTFDQKLAKKFPRLAQLAGE